MLVWKKSNIYKYFAILIAKMNIKIDCNTL